MDVNFYLTKPVVPLGNSQRENSSSQRKLKKTTVLKMKRLLLEDLNLIFANSQGALLLSFLSPMVLMGMISSVVVPCKKRREKPKVK